MTKEDFEKIEEMIEDGVWRVLSVVALMLGIIGPSASFWSCP